MADSYEVTEEGLDWAQAFLGSPVEADKSYELELEDSQRTALVAAGWLVPKKGK